ncbi:MAG: tRNA lysidine(34) synthetase TilS [Pseudomonadota bacterium]
MTGLEAADWARWRDHHRVGLAVSGGGDSVAMAVLAADAVGRDRLAIFSIDHGLRAAAADEVALVRKLAGELGVPFASATPGLAADASQDAARQARYAALHSLAQSHDVSALATGHTLEDQAETVLMRLGKKSSVAGLSGIGEANVWGLPILRPLLGVGREALRACLRARGVAWCDDPSNENDAYQRIAVRKLLPALAAAGVTAEGIAASAARLRDAHDALSSVFEARWGALVQPHRSLWLSWSAARYREDPREIRYRILERAVRLVGGADRPRRNVIERMDRALLAGEPTTGARCLARLMGTDIAVFREARAITPISLAPGETGIFDARFVCRAIADVPITIAPADALGLDRPPGLPTEAMRTAPAVVIGGDAEGCLMVGEAWGPAACNILEITPVHDWPAGGPSEGG